jgi:hypothetical protein
LWSVKIEHLDPNKDKIYIINQILAFGGMEELAWLFNQYSLREIRNVFINHSIKTYRKASFNFVKNILLEIKRPLKSKKYVAASF